MVLVALKAGSRYLSQSLPLLTLADQLTAQEERGSLSKFPH
jgi:hypothetical protein